MRKFKFTLIAFMAAMMALSFTACSDDDPEPNPNPDPEVNEDNYHFDLFVTVDKHGGMSSKNTTIVHSVNSLATEQSHHCEKRRFGTGRLFHGDYLKRKILLPNTRNQRPFRKISNQEQCSSGYCRTSFQGQQL